MEVEKFMKKKIISALLVVMLIIPTIAFTGCADNTKSGYITPQNTEPLYEFEEGVKTLIREDVYTEKKNNFTTESVVEETTTEETTENLVTPDVTTDTPVTADVTTETPVTTEPVENTEEIKQETVATIPAGKETVFKLVEENENYEFYFSEEYLEVCLVSKKTGEKWYSNPSPSERAAGIPGEMTSQLSLFYLNKEDGSQKTLESYTDCVLISDPDNQRYQYYVVNHNGNLRVIYILGLIKPDYIIPTCMDGELAESLAAKIKSEGDAKQKVVASYITNGAVFAKVTPQTWAKYTPDVKNEYLAIAPLMEDIIKEGKTVYIIKDQTKWNNSKLMRTVEDAFVNIGGMTLEQRNEINAQFGFESEAPKTFWIPVDYDLTDTGLKVTIESNEIQYDKESLAIASIDLLKYFGSASEKEEGYMFVPDGSGAIVNFNNGKTNITSDVRVQLYGLDDGRETLQKPFANEGSYLPVFGIKRTDSAMFAIIESGDTNATIIADIAGKNKNAVDRNRCYTRYKMAEYEELQFKSAGKTARIYQNEMNTDDIVVTYALLDGEKANYNGMAEYYRNYLISQNVISKKDFSEIPFNIELVGAYDHETAFLGVAYTETNAITTFAQCKEILQKLSDAGIKNVSVNYKGWANNGLRNTAFNRAKVLKELGGKDGLNDLIAFAEELGINLYFETELAFVYDSAMFDGYSEFTDASRLVTREVAYHYQYLDDWNTTSMDNKASIVSPTLIYDIEAEDNSKSFATKLLEDINELNIKGVSLGSLGYNLPGNYKVKDLRDRGEVANTYAAVAEMYSENLNVMAKGTNSYMLPYVDEVFEISNTSSKFNLADQSIPFYQMVIHGSIEYSGNPINLYGDTRQAFLEAVEAGSGLYYRWCYESNDAVQDLWFQGMYSLSYNSWIDESIEMYKEYNELLKSTAGAFIVEHENVVENVNKVTYENGVVVYVNYGSTDYTAADGTVVKAESFAKGGNN